MPRQTDTRDRLLHAASAVVRDDGAGALTLDAVAEAAGVSKGGLLYHFPTKDALHEALLDRLLDGTDRDVAALADAEAEGGARSEEGRFTRAFVRSSFDPGDAAAFGPAFIAAVAARPDLIDAARARYAEWQRRVEADGIDPARATAARLAADGLFFADLLGLAVPTGGLRGDVLRVLLQLCTPVGSNEDN